jgi:cytochrome P450
MIGLRLPSADIRGRDVQDLLSDPRVQVGGDAFLRSVILFMHSPCARHQEIETDPVTHKLMSRMTMQFLRRFMATDLAAIANAEVERWLQQSSRSPRCENLFDVGREIYIGAMFTLVFGEAPDEAGRAVYVAASKNMHETLKGTSTRKPALRARMIADLTERVARDETLQDFITESGLDFVAQHVTSSNFYTAVVQLTEHLAHSLAMIAANPEVAERTHATLAGDPAVASEYMAQVQRESLRLYPLFGQTTRVAMENVQAAGTDIPAGTSISLDFPLMHRDPEWPERDACHPERWLGNVRGERMCPIASQHFLPFGSGPRQCPAKGFAMRFSSLVIRQLLSRGQWEIPQDFRHSRRLPLGVPAAFWLDGTVRTPGDEAEATRYFRSQPRFQLDEVNWDSCLGTLRAIAANAWRQRAINRSAWCMLQTALQIQWLNKRS